MPNYKSSRVAEAERKHVRRRAPLQQHGGASCHQFFFFARQGKASKEIHAFLTETLGDHASLYATVKNWVAQFKFDDFFHLWCASSWTTQNSDYLGDVDQIHEVLLEGRRISSKSIAE